ncbi:MAG: helix-turn-helix transcriptional regulator [Desulfobacterales bacterium]|jgi:AcrR family transcriptional regulator|nr:helix-turn-helix transcriptional regulator [Desulfobacteraceae bacterium]MBT4363049.1 helix-turn-helix transcriptional regulator [Desulfobacteraceae bacterium]MBT7086587.1 helix-turn-helix transcriptional regulator [Desulfobacterales bacterium]MBT7696543.1 helix-turn-helix transcriptional regulator [Desulfobacterales bacterium]
MKKKKPHGREEVENALIEAAADLFSKNGIHSVSIREIASHAGVNHGLVHSYFGSKDNLRQRTREYLLKNLWKSKIDFTDFNSALISGDQVLGKDKRFMSFILREVTDNVKDKGPVSNKFPYVEKVVELVKKEQENGKVNSHIDPYTLVVGLIAMRISFITFRRFLLPAAGKDLLEVEKSISEIMEEWFSILSK